MSKFNNRGRMLIIARRAVDRAFQLEYRRRTLGIIPGGLAAIERHGRFRPPLNQLEFALGSNGSDDEVAAVIDKLRLEIAEFIGGPKPVGRF